MVVCLHAAASKCMHRQSCGCAHLQAFLLLAKIYPLGRASSSARLPTRSPVCILPSVCLSVCPSALIKTAPPAEKCVLKHLSVRLPTCLSVCLSATACPLRPSHPSVRLCTCLSVCLSVCPSVCPSICLSICLSIWLSVCVRPSTSQLTWRMRPAAPRTFCRACR
jgi:hypothetical protein